MRMGLWVLMGLLCEFILLFSCFFAVDGKLIGLDFVGKIDWIVVHYLSALKHLKHSVSEEASSPDSLISTLHPRFNHSAFLSL